LRINFGWLGDRSKSFHQVLMQINYRIRIRFNNYVPCCLPSSSTLSSLIVASTSYHHNTAAKHQHPLPDNKMGKRKLSKAHGTLENGTGYWLVKSDFLFWYCISFKHRQLFKCHSLPWQCYGECDCGWANNFTRIIKSRFYRCSHFLKYFFIEIY
jgi:hypothetical protein